MGNKSQKLSPAGLEQAEYNRSIWSITPDSGVTVEDMLRSDYWAHVSEKLRPGDRIEAVPADNSFFAEFFVLGRSKLWAKVILLREHKLFDDVEQEGDEYKVEWGGKHKWRVVRGTDVLHKGCDEKEEAEKWLKDHKKEIA